MNTTHLIINLIKFANQTLIIILLLINKNNEIIS